MSQGVGSSSGSRSHRPRPESAEPSVRRGKPRRTVEIEEEEVPETAFIVTEGEGLRAQWPHGLRLGASMAAGWTGKELVLAPERHISRRLLQGEPIGHMRTFSGFTSVFKAYHKSLSVESKGILDGCAFGPLIGDWLAIAGAKTTANLVAWIFSHFPSLLPPGFESPSTYPAVRAWACCDRSDWGWTYDDVQRRLNELTSDQFVPRPFTEYRRLPHAVATRMLPRDAARLYLGTPFDSFWYLGELLACQAGHPRFVVPSDPPACLFVQTPDPEVRRTLYQEGESSALLHEDADYAAFARTRLAPGWLQAYDPDMECQPPDFPSFVEYEDREGELRLELPRVTTVTTDSTDSGMDP